MGYPLCAHLQELPLAACPPTSGRLARVVSTVLCAGALALSAPASAASDLTLTVTSDRVDTGQIVCVLYDNKRAWLRHKHARAVATAELEDGEGTCVFPDLPAGTYAIAYARDRNHNERIDLGMYLTPQEPWGVSRRTRLGSLRPSFASAVFEHPGEPLPVGQLQATPDIMLLPGLFYSQETAFGFALIGSLSIPLRAAGEDAWPSNITVIGVTTLIGQSILQVFPSFYLGDDNLWALEGRFSAEHFPTRYFGRGMGATPDYQVFTRRRIDAGFAFRRRAFERLFIGAGYEIRATAIQGITPWIAATSTGLLEDDEVGLGQGVPGEAGSRVTGPSFNMRWDSRDNIQSTRTGLLLDFYAAGYPSWLGTTHPFFMTTVDARAFLPFAGTGTFATRVRFEARIGDPPFDAMGELGGEHLMRGLFKGRFRDHNLTTLDLELRSPMLWRIRAVGFAALGQVFGPATVGTRHPPSFVAGGGFRFEFDRETHTTIRADVAAGPDGFGIIITAGEAF